MSEISQILFLVSDSLLIPDIIVLLVYCTIGALRTSAAISR